MANRICAVEECDRIEDHLKGKGGRFKRGMCSKHYQRWLKYDDPHKTAVIVGDDSARLLSKIDASGDCWEWMGGRQVRGYGKLTIRGKSVLAHRAIWEHLVGPIPDGLTLDHLCRNPPCVNPDHLEPVTMRENLLRGESFAAHNARKTHCKRGHPLSGDNLARWDNQRYCRACHRMRKRRWKEANKSS